MSVKATVFIPTFNGEHYLEEIIDAIEGQEFDGDFEILIIDSGSKDKTLDIIKVAQNKYDNIRLHQIPNKEFGHGKTRNLAAELARGDFIVYLTHDATPATPQWLYEMLKPFELGDNIVAVMGRQIPRGYCIPMLKYEIVHTFRNFGPEFGTTLFYKDGFITDRGIYDATRFYSDVNSAARVEFILNTVPYRNVKYAEDQLFGEDVIDAGYTKAYAPRGAVLHSNDLTLKEYKPRMFDETLALRLNGTNSLQPFGLRTLISMIVKGVLRDTLRIMRDGGYSKKRRLYWMVLNPFFHIQKWRGVRAALLVDIDDGESLDRGSLEARRRRGEQ